MNSATTDLTPPPFGGTILLMNVSRVSSRRLVAIIGLSNQEERRTTNGPVSVGEVAVILARRIIVRQKAINILRSRMSLHLNLDVLSELKHINARFAKVFCEKHLGMHSGTYQVQGHLDL